VFEPYLVGVPDSDQPLVSAVIPSHNYGRFVGEAIDSVLGQTHGNVECVVVDDGSTDDTPERLARYGDRIRAVRTGDAGLGVSTARNIGIELARGQWVAFLDADDVWHREKIAVQLRAVLDAGADFGLSQRAELLDAPLPTDPAVRSFGPRDVLAGAMSLNPSGAIVRKECVRAVGGFEPSLKVAEDRHLWVRLATRFRCVEVLSRCWMYRTHDEQVTRKATLSAEQYRRMLELFFQQHPEHGDLADIAYAYFHVDAAHGFIAEQRRARAVWHLVRSIQRCAAGFPGKRLLRSKLLVRALLGERTFHRWRPGRNLLNIASGT
jgi:glycosyltransferase involved in cell wall biosynthesis